ncbi:hypothetical protein THIOM_003919 [Candidatus Thiomargarita nelsonii]|uniref:Uncharacterized protein n=1 Tax=Candidatus Thiomargarita nelsonii TaxID=1003181 RepID=A0A176RXB4_9GAMM|nr:hypothetical protein THIOM_003919 [Candidatus Thiomargarita nelsonii]
MWQNIKSDLFGINFGRNGFAIEQRSRLPCKFFNGFFTAARDCLISRYVNPLNPNGIINGFKGNQHLYGGTIRIGNDIA